MNHPTYKITITDIAAKAFKDKLAIRGTPDAYVRLGVRANGCEGYKYVIEYYDNTPREKDLEFVFNDIKVIIDKKSILYLNGCVLDWEKTLISTGFKFTNPAEVSKCGCGESFSIKK